MKPVAYAYINKRECSVQECVYYILSGQWLRKTFSGVVFANGNLPEKNKQDNPYRRTTFGTATRIDRYI